MRTLALRRRIVGLPVTILAAFSLLLQVALAPGVFSAPSDTLPAICHAATGDDRAPQPIPGHGCDHCMLCRAGAVAFLLPPPAPLLPAPVVTALAAVRLPADAAPGAAWPAYASRAPPAIG
jgi:hypothetical protein